MDTKSVMLRDKEVEFQKDEVGRYFTRIDIAGKSNIIYAVFLGEGPKNDQEMVNDSIHDPSQKWILVVRNQRASLFDKIKDNLFAHYSLEGRKMKAFGDLVDLFKNVEVADVSGDRNSVSPTGRLNTADPLSIDEASRELSDFAKQIATGAAEEFAKKKVVVSTMWERERAREQGSAHTSGNTPTQKRGT